MTGKNYCKVEHKWCKFCRHNCCLYTEPLRGLREIHKCPKVSESETISFRNLLKSVEIEKVLENMYTYWPEEIKQEKKYREVFEKLKTIKGERTRWKIEVRICKDVFGGVESTWLNTLGISPKNGKTYAIECVPWNQWVNMHISQETLDTLAPEEICAGCLYELTWCGFEEESGPKFEQQLRETFEEMKEQELLK